MFYLLNHAKSVIFVKTCKIAAVLVYQIVGLVIAIDVVSSSKEIGLGPPAFPPAFGARRGTTGVSTNGVTANFHFFVGGTFWVLPR